MSTNDTAAIIGYTFGGQCYTPAALVESIELEHGGTMPGGPTVEDKLNEWARREGLDRAALTDSDYFPTALYADDIRPGAALIVGFTDVRPVYGPAALEAGAEPEPEEVPSYTLAELNALDWFPLTLNGGPARTAEPGGVVALWNRYSMLRVFRAVARDDFREVAYARREDIGTVYRAASFALALYRTVADDN
jgi:hypothetical protein